MYLPFMIYTMNFSVELFLHEQSGILSVEHYKNISLIIINDENQCYHIHATHRSGFFRLSQGTLSLKTPDNALMIDKKYDIGSCSLENERVVKIFLRLM
jgi:hypothetical protein